MNFDFIEKAISVTDLTNFIKSSIEGNVLTTNIIVKGEVSNFKKYNSGHAYFTLKDKDSIISCVFFNIEYHVSSYFPKEGDEILCFGSVKVYGPRGNYQLVVENISLFGQGLQLLKLEELKKKLYQEGLFDESIKKEIPKMPEVVGIIAGKGSAAIKDITYNIQIRNPLIKIFFFPSLVEGDKAGADLVSAFEETKKYPLDVLIISRGGGSKENLNAFNDEKLIRALATRTIPLISAVGHEVDFTLTDLVADKRVSTPTAAAQLVAINKNDLLQQLDSYFYTMESTITNSLAYYKERFESLKKRSFFTNPSSIYADKIDKLEAQKQKMKILINSLVNSKIAQAKALNDHLEAINPRNVLNRGYSILTDEEGKVIKSINEVEAGQIVNNVVKDGMIKSQILKKEKTRNG